MPTWNERIAQHLADQHGISDLAQDVLADNEAEMVENAAHLAQARQAHADASISSDGGARGNSIAVGPRDANTAIRRAADLARYGYIPAGSERD